MVKTIKLTQDQFAIVDDEDYEYLNQWPWCAAYSKSISGFYAQRNQNIGTINGKQKTIRMHRAIMGRILGRELKRTEVIDHINHDPLDNTRENLRIVSTRQNNQNKKSKTSSKYPGVCWNKQRNKWKAYITLNGKQKHLGYFMDEREAAKAYEKACRTYVGEELICKSNKIDLDKHAYAYEREAVGDDTYWGV